MIRRRYYQTLRYRVSDTPLSQSCSPARQAKHLCYVIHICAIETRFRLRRPQPPTLHVCACLCAFPAPSPSIAGDGCSRETASGHLPSCLTLITRRGNKQTRNVLACKFSETPLTVKRQRYPIVDYFVNYRLPESRFTSLNLTQLLSICAKIKCH